MVDPINMSNSNCTWYSNSLKTCLLSDSGKHSNLQYVYRHDYDSNSFSDMKQFSVLQEHEWHMSVIDLDLPVNFM